MGKLFVIEVISEIDDEFDTDEPTVIKTVEIEPGKSFELIWETSINSDPEVKTIEIYRDGELMVDLDIGYKLDYTSRRTIKGSFQ